MRSIDRRIEGHLDSAARGRLSREKMHALSIAAAADRLAAEDALEAVERRINDYVDAAGHKRGRERAVADLLDRWDELSFAKQHAGLLEAVSRVTVIDDDAVKITLRA